MFLEDIISLFAEQEILAETPRSKKVYKQLCKERGSSLSAYNIGEYFDRLESEIKPTEALNSSFDPSDLIKKLSQETSAIIRPEMTIAEVAQILA